MASGRSVPEIEQLSDGQIAIDYGPPGPYVTLKPLQVRGLIEALAHAGWVLLDGKPLRPKR